MKLKVLALSLCLSLGASALLKPAQAQYYGSPYSFLYLGQSLLYPLSRTIGSGYMYGPYNSNPFFSTNSYLRGNYSRAMQWPYIYPYANNTFGPYGYRNGGMMPNFTNGNSANSAQNAPITPADEPDNANPGDNTMNSTNPYQTQTKMDSKYNLPPAVVPSSGGAPGGIGASPYGSFGSSGSSGFSNGTSASPVNAPPVNAGMSDAAPPVAPKLAKLKHSKKQKVASVPAAGNSTSAVAPATSSGGVNTSVLPNSSPNLSVVPPAVPTSAMARPLAEGFINHLNSNYQGDMSKALGNSDTRSWAKAMGVIDPDILDGSHLSGDRLEVIGRVLKDNTLDPMSKLDTMRILLKK